MHPNFWLIVKCNNPEPVGDRFLTYVEEFNTKEQLNIYLGKLYTNDVESLEIISGFSLSKRTVSGE